MVNNTKKANDELLFNKLKNAGELFRRQYDFSYIHENLKNTLRPYQSEALRYLNDAQNINNKENYFYKHLLFNMATGSGKTMVMAAIILYMFKEYNHHNFIFFVHTDAIIQKTHENFFNPQSPKYLFRQSLEIDGRSVSLLPVDTFPVKPEENTIYLKLSTIHKIHDELNNPKENSLTYEDLSDTPLVLLGDEAHHFNAGTKIKGKKKTSSEYEALTWERTIERILNTNAKNRLFEFTATIDLSNKEIFYKYKDKIVYQYDLKQFMLDGYSKKVMLMEADQDDRQKMMDAVLLSQYRKLIAIDNGIEDFKPIVLFKSNKISISNNKQIEFSDLISSLSPATIREYLAIKSNQGLSSTSIWHKIIKYYKSSDLVRIVQQVKNDFSDFHILNVNKSNMLDSSPVILNTLEEIDNPIRVIFAVAKVNEGWDVLNLYDIVRISEAASASKTGTDSEAQLIGRGARYYPFIYQGQKSFQRRFDESTNDISVLEQLHYHTINSPIYIKNLHDSLDQANIVAQNEGSGTVVRAALKKSFKESSIYKKGKLYFNETEEIDNASRSWETYSLGRIIDISFDSLREESLTSLSDDISSKKTFFDLYVDKRFYRKAMQRIRFFKLDNLKKYFPKLNSINEFISDEAYMGSVIIRVSVPEDFSPDVISASSKLALAEKAFLKISDMIRKNYTKSKGTLRYL